MDNILQAALSYLDAGLSVMPVNRESKSPRLGRWKPYQERRPTVQEVRDWYPFDAICIVCGPVSGGMEMIDFDFGAEAWAAWVAAVGDNDLLARLVVEQSQSGGRHVIYRCHEIEGNQKLALRGYPSENDAPILIGKKKYRPLRQADGTFAAIVALIETRGSGGYFLCCPTTGYEMVQGDLSAIPTITAQERARLLQAARSLNEWTPPAASAQPRGSAGTFQPQSIQPGEDYNVRANIPQLLEDHGWKFVGDDGLNQKWRRPGKDSGHSATWCESKRKFYCFSSSAGLPCNEGISPFALLAHLEHAGDFSSTSGALRARGFGGTDAQPDVDFSAIMGITENVADAETSDELDHADPGQLPDDLLNVPGFMGEVIAYNLATSLYPLPPLALAGAIALMGTLTGRKVADEQDNRTNVYVVGTAGSGAGKDRARQVNRQILYYAGAGHLEGPEDIASDAGLISVVEKQPAVLFQLDEIGRFLKTLANAAQNPHLYGIMSVLMKLYTSANSIYKGKAYSQRNKKGNNDVEENHEILNPCVSVYGTGVPEDFYQAMTIENLENGSLARMMVFEGTAPQRINRCKPQPIPESILAQARGWANLKLDSGNLGPMSTEKIIAAATPEATGRLEACQEAAYAERGRSDRAGAAIWARCAEKAYRLALIAACSKHSLALASGSGNLIIGEADADWACRLAEWNTRRVIWLADRWVSSSPFEDKTKKILRFMQEHGGRATRRDIMRRFSLDLQECSKLTTSLMAAERIVSTRNESGREFYQLCHMTALTVENSQV